MSADIYGHLARRAMNNDDTDAHDTALVPVADAIRKSSRVDAVRTGSNSKRRIRWRLGGHGLEPLHRPADEPVQIGTRLSHLVAQ